MVRKVRYVRKNDVGLAEFMSISPKGEIRFEIPMENVLDPEKNKDLGIRKERAIPEYYDE